MFTPGAEVLFTNGCLEGTQRYYLNIEKYRCVVVEPPSDCRHPRIRFYATAKCPGYREGHDFGVFNSFSKHMFSPTNPPLSNQEKVLAKIKLLEKRYSLHMAKKEKEKQYETAPFSV